MSRVRADMTVEQAVDILETYGSADDPIEFLGPKVRRELLPMESPRSLSANHEGGPFSNTPAGKIRVRYYSGYLNKHVEGTLEDMVFDRMELKIRDASTRRWRRA